MKYYVSIKDKLLTESKGKFALIKAGTLVGIFDTDVDAYKAGLLKLGNVPFLIVQVLEQNPHPWIPIVQLGLLLASSQ
jgi:hypothetical protein